MTEEGGTDWAPTEWCGLYRLRLTGGRRRRRRCPVVGRATTSRRRRCDGTTTCEAGPLQRQVGGCRRRPDHPGRRCTTTTAATTRRGRWRTCRRHCRSAHAPQATRRPRRAVRAGSRTAGCRVPTSSSRSRHCVVDRGAVASPGRSYEPTATDRSCRSTRHPAPRPLRRRRRRRIWRQRATTAAGRRRRWWSSWAEVVWAAGRPARSAEWGHRKQSRPPWGRCPGTVTSLADCDVDSTPCVRRSDTNICTSSTSSCSCSSSSSSAVITSLSITDLHATQLYTASLIGYS